jgi:cytidylate kinase
MIITIDGPAGAGKSTAARNLARALDIAFLDTGATYRAATLKALREQVDMADPSELAELARRADIRLELTDGQLRVLLDGEDVSRDIRTPEVTGAAHHLAGPGEVRQVMVELQRRIGRQLGSFVSEGRDQGSVVFPDADVKFYLQADPMDRAQRRWEDFRQAGRDVELSQVLADIEQRDRRDTGRQVGPLVQPDGAIVIDNSGLSAEQTLDALLAHVPRHA